MSQLTQVQNCLKESAKKGETVSVEQTVEVLEKIHNKSSFETQRTLALEMNLPIGIHEKVKPQQDDSIRLEVTLTKEQFEELQKAKSLLSHICPEGSWSEVVGALAKKFNSRKLKGRTKTVALSEKTTQSFAVTEVQVIANQAQKLGRRYISVHTKRMLFAKAQNCCEYKDPRSHQRCKSKYKLEIDHRHPIALGGTNDLRNLRVLCQTHNALAARQAGLEGFG